MFLSARTERNQRCAKGAPSMNTSPKAGVHRRHPPGPPFYGGGSLRVFGKPRRAKSRPVSVLLSGHRAFLPTKFVSCCFYCTPPNACLPVWCGGGRVDQLPRFCQSRRCPHSADTLKFLTRQAPVSRGKQNYRTDGAPAKAQRSGFGGERRSKEAT